MARVETMPAARPTGGHATRVEWAIVAAVVLVAFAARAWRLGAVGLNHFDEGAYVFSGMGLSDPSQQMGLFPGQVRFAPPVYFTLIALADLVAGRPSDLTAFAVNVLIGTVTVPLVWFTARRWFGPGPAVAAAALLALNEFHIGLSRAALTDVTFAAVFVASLVLVAEALERASVRLAVVAGVVVGLAWNTKYHGWFAVVIGAIAIAIRSWHGPRTLAAVRRPAIVLTTIGAVAVACYVPWALFVQSTPGGYAALSAYQSTLLSLRWIHNALLQARMQWYLEGLVSRVAPSVALLCVAVVSGSVARWNSRMWLMAVAVSIAGAVAGSAAFAVSLTALALPALVRECRDYRSAVFLAWVALFVVMTPFYHPYARLLLPLTLATLIGAGTGLQGLMADEGADGGTPTAVALRATGVLALAALVAIAVTRSEPTVWRASRSAADAAGEMAPLIPADMPVLVLGEPQVGYYLRLAGKHVLVGQDSVTALDRLAKPAFIVSGVYSKRSPQLRERLGRMRERLETVGNYPFHPNDLRLLDDFTPDRARAYRSRPDDTFDLTLNRFVPATVR